MEFINISSSSDYRIQEIVNSYCTSFPEAERRNEEQFKNLFSQPCVNILSIFHENENIGYLVIWKLSGFVFVEHFEVFERFRNKKYGSEVISHLFQEYPKIVLEIEPETLDDLAKKRYHFYQRNGFNIIDENYIQPSYGDGKPSLELWLLSNFPTENTLQIREEIYDVVYK